MNNNSYEKNHCFKNEGHCRHEIQIDPDNPQSRKTVRKYIEDYELGTGYNLDQRVEDISKRWLFGHNCETCQAKVKQQMKNLGLDIFDPIEEEIKKSNPFKLPDFTK